MSPRHYASVGRAMRESAEAFEQHGWPCIGPLLGGGQLVRVEAVADHMRVVLDTLAGVDAWQVCGGAVHGIASRVQWDTGKAKFFTIRGALPSGEPTEYQKRMLAHRAGDGRAGPTWMIHTFMAKDGVHVQRCMAVRTDALMDYIGQPGYVDNGYHWRTNRADGVRFIVADPLAMLRDGVGVVLWPQAAQGALPLATDDAGDNTCSECGAQLGPWVWGFLCERCALVRA